MIILGLAVLGVALGAWTAKKRKGSGADIAQYAAVYGIAFALLGLVTTLVLDRVLF